MEVTKREAPTPVRIPKEVKDKLLKLAEKESRPLGNLINYVLKEYLVRQKRKTA